MNSFTSVRRASLAASWNVRVDSGELSDAERQAMLAWLIEPGNASEYHAQRHVLDWARDLPAARKTELLKSIGTRRRRVRVAWRLAAGVVALAALGCTAWLAAPGLLSRSYVSGIGEMRTVGLPDGSMTSLNTRTRLRWIGSLAGRRVLLEGGEALFEVTPDRAHPFQIELKRSRITVLGTRFDVYEKTPDDVVVTVLRGTVVVQGFAPGGEWRERLGANQEIEYTADGRRTVRVVDAAAAAEWSGGIFHSEGASLARIVSELGRYTRAPIIIADPSLSALTVGGVFDIHDVPAALQRLAAAADVPITVTRSGGAFVLRRARPSAATGAPVTRGAPPQEKGP
jgi:transmembrane sensor